MFERAKLRVIPYYLTTVPPTLAMTSWLTQNNDRDVVLPHPASAAPRRSRPRYWSCLNCGGQNQNFLVEKRKRGMVKTKLFSLFFLTSWKRKIFQKGRCALARSNKSVSQGVGGRVWGGPTKLHYSDRPGDGRNLLPEETGRGLTFFFISQVFRLYLY